MARPAAPRPYPLQPLEEVAGMSPRALAGRLGVPARSILRLRHLGLTVDQADRFAVALNIHPGELWPTWIDDHLTYLDRRFVEQGGWRDDWLYREAANA